MRSSALGKSTSQVEVQDIMPQGIWLLIQGVEYFLAYQDFPWFRKGTVEEIHDVYLLHGNHLHWPQLDVDLSLASLRNLEKYPLKYI